MWTNVDQFGKLEMSLVSTSTKKDKNTQRGTQRDCRGEQGVLHRSDVSGLLFSSDLRTCNSVTVPTWNVNKLFSALW